jgi:hypothetical protein
MTEFRNLTDAVFGRVKVIGLAGFTCSGTSIWLCKCLDCGRKFNRRQGNLARNGCRQCFYRGRRKPKRQKIRKERPCVWKKEREERARNSLTSYYRKCASTYGLPKELSLSAVRLWMIFINIGLPLNSHALSDAARMSRDFTGIVARELESSGLLSRYGRDNRKTRWGLSVKSFEILKERSDAHEE